MAVAPASMADEIIVLGDEEGSSASPCVASTSPSNDQAKNVSPHKLQQPAPTHITKSPFASAKKQTHVLQAENERLFSEFVEHCSPLTQDCPEVLTFLTAKHAKACPQFLSSVEFRNTLGRCLTRAQANRAKTFVYINELCTVLRQHSAKRRQMLSKVEAASSTSSSNTRQSTSAEIKSKDKTKVNEQEEEEQGKQDAEDEQPSTSGLQDNNKEEDKEAERKASRASRKQIAYLENLLKVYNDEICRLQQMELSLDDMGAEDSLYIQEHKLKRKMMKIYEKLCELKGCSTMTGRVIEQRILYKGTRYPEINRRIERYINSPEVQSNPPDYQDILQQVLRANERHNLCLNKNRLKQIAQDAFRDIGKSIQDRRHLDLVYNFGSPLTDQYKPAADPALSDSSLQKKLRVNREVAVTRLEEVISKFATKQEDTEEEERNRRLKKDGKKKEGNKSEKGDGGKEVNGVTEEQKEGDREEEEEKEEEEEEEDDDEEDESSDPDIEEEIKASTRQDGPDEDELSNEAEQAEDDANKEDQTDEMLGSAKDDEEEPATSGLSPLSDDSKTHFSLSDIPSPKDSPSQSEPVQAADNAPLSNGNVTGAQEAVDSSSQVSAVPVSTSRDSSVETNGDLSAASPAMIVEKCDTRTNGTSPPPSPRATRSRKRKREETTGNSQNTKHIIIQERYSRSHCLSECSVQLYREVVVRAAGLVSAEAEIPLDMGVISYSSPPQTELTRADTPTQDLVSSSQSTPPPKKNKVNVATQCDPDEIIVLSDSE
ncbi:hypothetical protein INR49_003443 [Caranx melampygus]|nr:hypothetical protein INR49_003443 [Caranx melampygus]